MIDGFGRTIDYLRISVTDRCNLRCVYCMKEEQQEFLPSGELLTLEEWVRLCKGAALAGIRKIRITGGEPLMRQDIVELVEAISNIVDNAVKYTPSGGKVEISVEALTSLLRVDIRDTGRGIPEEEQARIFSRFYRAGESARMPGVGIGLYIAREVMQAQNGYIRVSSKPGEGSMFSLYFLR